MKRLALILIAVAALAFMAQAAGPWNGIWGVDFSEWVWTGGTPYQSECIYNPTIGDFHVEGNPLAVDWPELTVEMYIEFEIEVHYSFTNVQIHSASDYSQFIVELCNNWISENGQCIFQIEPYLTYTTGALVWQSGIPGTYTPGNPIPVTDWQINLMGAGWVGMGGTSGGIRSYTFPVCHTDFCYRFTVNPEYHQAPGYYKMMVTLCPAPVL